MPWRRVLDFSLSDPQFEPLVASSVGAGEASVTCHTTAPVCFLAGTFRFLQVGPPGLAVLCLGLDIFVSNEIEAVGLKPARWSTLERAIRST